MPAGLLDLADLHLDASPRYRTEPMDGGRKLAGGAAAALVCAAVSAISPGLAAAGNPAQVFTPVADGFVTATAPRTNYGRTRSLQVRAKPPRRAYLRFRVDGLSGGVVSARLRVFVTRPGRAGLQVRAIAEGRWNER